MSWIHLLHFGLLSALLHQVRNNSPYQNRILTSSREMCIFKIRIFDIGRRFSSIARVDRVWMARDSEIICLVNVSCFGTLFFQFFSKARFGFHSYSSSSIHFFYSIGKYINWSLQVNRLFDFFLRLLGIILFSESLYERMIELNISHTHT